MNKTDIIKDSGVKNGKQWYKIDITKVKDKLSSNEYEKFKNKLEYHFLPSYFWIYEDNFDNWFKELNEAIDNNKEEHTNGAIDNIFNRLVKDNKKYDVAQLKSYFNKYPDLYEQAISLASYQNNKSYYLPVKKTNEFKELIQEAENRNKQFEDNLKSEGAKAATEAKDKEIEEIQQQHKEEIQQERRDKNIKVAEAINKYKPIASSGPIDAKPERTITTTTNSPSIHNFIKNAFLNGDYKRSPEELRKLYTTGKYTHILKDVNVDNVINDIMLYSELELSKRKNKLAQLAQIGAFSPEAITHMPPNVQQDINDAIIAKSRIDNANRRLKYKLPINKPKARQAMLNGHINPMLFRGAYSTGNY